MLDREADQFLLLKLPLVPLTAPLGFPAASLALFVPLVGLPLGVGLPSLNLDTFLQAILIIPGALFYPHRVAGDSAAYLSFHSCL